MVNEQDIAVLDRVFAMRQLIYDESIKNETLAEFYLDPTSEEYKESITAWERIRASVQQLAEAKARADRVEKALRVALALTDTGTDEFKAAFPSRSVAAAMFRRDSVLGWPVVERIREILLDAGSPT